MNDRCVVAVGPEGGGLLHAELGHGADSARVVDDRRAVFDDGVHHRSPAHAQFGRHPRQRPRVLAEVVACLGAGRAGERRLSID